MAPRDGHTQHSQTNLTSVEVPPGAPNWVTVELIEQTLRVWQPYYEKRLIPEDALTMILNIGRLFEVLSSGANHEAVSRVGTRQQS